MGLLQHAVTECMYITGIYAAVKSNVDVEKVLVDYHLLAGASSQLGPPRTGMQRERLEIF